MATLGVDRAFPSSLSPMEAKGCSSRRWRSRIPEFTRSVTGGPTSIRTSIKNTERARDGDRGRHGPRKSVTMAPTSRYMTDGRQYALRKPLFATEQQTSILKRSYAEEHPEQEKQWGGSAMETHRPPHHHHTGTDFHTSRAEDEIPDPHDRWRADVLRSPASRADLHPPSLGVRPWLCLEDPVLGSPYLDSGPGRRSLSSPPLEVQQLSSPLSPRLSSTLLSPPSYTPPPHRLSRPRHTELRLGGGGGGDTHRNVASSLGYLKSHSPPSAHITSPQQADYWACAIPRSKPPSPDRRSPSWDPDKEYQALLDYTYPLRPGKVVSGLDTSVLGDGSLLREDPGLQDSGIELDRLCSSTSLSALDFSFSGALVTGTARAREKTVLGIGQRSRSSETRGLLLSRSSDGILSCSPYSSADPIGLSLESLDCSRDRSGPNHSARGRGGLCRQQEAFSTSSTFIRSTGVLPRPGCLGGGAWDEEFWPLPKRLEEFQVLSRQVMEVTAQLSQPVTASWESLERETASVHSSTTLPEKREAEDEEEEERRKEEEEREEENDAVDGSEDPQCPSKEIRGGYDLQAPQSARPRTELPGAGGVTRASLREVEAMVEQLVGLTLSENQRRSRGEHEYGESLMQHIQTFCSNLEELIQWLYTVVEKMEVLSPPAVDIESVKSSLADYKSFQREVSARQPLTSSVLQTGELLLNCMTSTSPVLKDTLGLIERQSQALETHTEHLFSSILAAMDSLTQPSRSARTPQPEELEPGTGGEAGARGRGRAGAQGSVM